MLIILIGLPGSGKGTQGKFLASALKLPHLSTGDTFRQMIAGAKREGKLLASYITAGKLVPEDLVNNIVAKLLASNTYQNGCLLDGYPRNIEQAKFLATLGVKPSKVFYLDVDDHTIIKRILGRFSCEICRKDYNLYFNKPKVADTCDRCGAMSFFYRTDDNEQTIKKRVEIFKSETYPLIEYYQNNSSFHKVDASKGKKQVASQLLTLLKRS